MLMDLSIDLLEELVLFHFLDSDKISSPFSQHACCDELIQGYLRVE